VGTKWQSSHMIGNIILISLKGNHKFGNEFVEIREILLDLWLKVNYVECQTILEKISSYTTFFYVIINISWRIYGRNN